MDLHLQQGAHADAWKAWERAQELLIKYPDIQPYWRKRLPDLKVRCDRLKSTPQKVLAASEKRAAQAIKDVAPVGQTGAGADNLGNVSEAGTGAGTEQGGLLPGLLIQPALVETRVMPGESANARFHAVNLSANALEAELSLLADTFACEWEVVSADTVVGKLISVAENAEKSAGQAISIPAGQVVNVFMTWQADEAGAANKAKKQHSVRLAWNATEESYSEWLFGVDSVWRNVAVVDASLVVNNAFLYVPFYHSIYYREGGEAVIDLHVKAMTPCRIEIYEEGSNNPLALDANGDGDYLDEGDAIFSDSNGNHLPDLIFSDATAVKNIEIWVFPLDGNNATFTEEIEVRVSAGEKGNLQLQAVDKLMPAVAN